MDAATVTKTIELSMITYFNSIHILFLLLPERAWDWQRENWTQVTWQHYNRNDFRVVTGPKGGGNRNIPYKPEEDITTDYILEQVKKYLFPDGNSFFGNLNAMSMTLVISSGQ